MPDEIFKSLVENSLKPTDYQNSQLIFYMNYYWIIQFVVYNLQLIVYSILVVIYVRKYFLIIKKYYSNAEKLKIKWIYLIIGLNLFFNIWDFSSVYFQIFYKYTNLYYIMSFLYVSFLGIYSLKHQYIDVISQKTDDNDLNKQKFTELLLSDIQQNTFDEKIIFEKDKRILDILTNLMEEQELYLDPDLKLNDIARKIGVHRNIISKIINQYWKVNFFQCVNNYRIEKAKELLLDPNYKHLSIEGIAKSVGFNSKSVFNPLFKKKYGVTPSNFRKEKNDSVL